MFYVSKTISRYSFGAIGFSGIFFPPPSFLTISKLAKLKTAQNGSKVTDSGQRQRCVQKDDKEDAVDFHSANERDVFLKRLVQQNFADIPAVHLEDDAGIYLG